MRKLYTDVLLENPFMVTYNNNTVQACANDEDTITIGSTEFVRVTDVDGHNVSDGEGCQLLLSDGIIYKLVEGVPESTNITVTDVTPVAQYTFTISQTPNDAVVYINDGVSELSRLSVTVDDGTTVTWRVQKAGYVTQTGSYTVNGADHTEYVTLQVEQFTFTLDPTPADAVCTINGETRTSLTANVNTSIAWSVAKTGYVTETGTHTLIADHTEVVTLTPDVQPEPINYDGDFKSFYYLGCSTTPVTPSGGAIDYIDSQHSNIAALPSTGTIRISMDSGLSQEGMPTTSVGYKVFANNVEVLSVLSPFGEKVTITVAGTSNPIEVDMLSDAQIFVTPTEAAISYFDFNNNQRVSESIPLNNALVALANSLRGTGDDSSGTKSISTGLTFVHYEDGVATSDNEYLVQLFQFSCEWNYNPAVVGNAYSGASGVVTSTGDGSTNTTMVEISTSNLLGYGGSGLTTPQFKDASNFDLFENLVVDTRTNPDDPDDPTTYKYIGTNDGDGTYFDGEGNIMRLFIKAKFGYLIDSPYVDDSMPDCVHIKAYDELDNEVAEYDLYISTGATFIDMLRNGSFTLNQQIPSLTATKIDQDGVVLKGEVRTDIPTNP